MKSFEIKSKINHNIYYLLKKGLFRINPETTHNIFINIGKFIEKSSFSKRIISTLFNYHHPSLEQNLLGIKFRNPVGLSAGFDKNADLMNVMQNVGFGFAEVGSVTAKPSNGNKGIRLMRILNSKGLWVNLGLNNIGAVKIKDKLKDRHFEIPVGINIAKTNCIETTDSNVGLKDYIYSLKQLRNEGDYFTINISCPNAFGGQSFADPKLYEILLNEIDQLGINKPIFVKLSPDLDKNNIDLILNISKKHKVDGFICTNLTKDKTKGGYSGKILKDKSDDLLSYVYGKTKFDRYILIGSGGIFSAEDAYRKIKLGANLVQLITGMIYNGPALIGEINYGLVKLLEKDGFRNISEAVGVDNFY